MKIDMEKLSKSLADFGMHPKRIPYFLHLLAVSLKYVSDEEAVWSMRHGFMPDDIRRLRLTEENYHNYLTMFDYFMGFPHNNHFAFWINDKLTLKYMCENEKLRQYMPKYYLYIENDGKYTYLMDSPPEIKKDENYLLHLVQTKKELAMKPNNGALGNGFIHLEWRDSKLVANGDTLTEEAFETLKMRLNGYVVTEYIRQHKELDRFWDKSACTLRVITYKKVRDNAFSPPEFGVLWHWRVLALHFPERLRIYVKVELVFSLMLIPGC